MALAESPIGLDASFPAQPTQVAPVRRAVCDVAARHGACPETIMRLGLAVSEGATNVVLHAYREPGTAGAIHVTAHIHGGVLEVCIGDDGVGMSPRPDSPGLGLGILLMAGECDHFEMRSSETGGTMLVLRFDLRPALSAEPRQRFARAAGGERAQASA